MIRRFLIVVLMLTMILPNFAFANAGAEMTIIEKTSAVEKVLYGAEQTGALVDRVSKVEKDIFGIEAKDALAIKLDRVYAYAKENSAGAPSLITKLNAVEWTLNRNVSPTLAAKERLEALERAMMGSAQPGAVHDRLNKLIKLALFSGWPEVSPVDIAKDTLVKIKLSNDLNSKSSRSGDVVMFTASEDVFIDGVLIIAKGSPGLGKVNKVEEAKNFGRDAKLELSFDSIEAIDGTSVATLLGDKAKEETKSLAKAAGASVAGMVILGPVGVVGGAFIQGRQVNIPAGTEIYIQTKDAAAINGIKVK